MQARTIVLDANILIRAILGTQARQLILDHAMAARFFAPDVAYADARTYLPALLQRRGIPEGPLMEVLDRLEAVVRPLTAEIYAPYRDRALDRIASLADAMAPWQDAVEEGQHPQSWTVRERLESLGCLGLIDPSRKAPGLWHLVLFSWGPTPPICVTLEHQLAQPASR